MAKDVPSRTVDMNMFATIVHITQQPMMPESSVEAGGPIVR